MRLIGETENTVPLSSPSLSLSPLFFYFGVSFFEQLILENVEGYFTFSLKEFFGSFGF